MRSACWRKSGVVSITTCCPLRDKSTEGRRRLSRGSAEVQTRQWQPREGTPMEVPEPRIVSFKGFDGMCKNSFCRPVELLLIAFWLLLAASLALPGLDSLRD